MGYSDQEKLEEFQHLKEELNDFELAAEIIPKGKLFEDMTLLVCLPSVEEIPENEEEMTDDQVHFASGILLDMDEAQERLAKYLVFYSQIRVDMTGLDELTVLRIVNLMNRTVRIGHYFYDHVSDQDGNLVQYRATVTGVPGELLDEGVVADTIIEMGAGYDMMKAALMEAAGQKQ